MSMSWPSADLGGSHDRVSMRVGVAVARAVEALAPHAAVRLKWPYDVMVEGRKLAGILIEAVADAFIIGIGLNVLPSSASDASLATIATSLSDIGAPTDRLSVIEQIVVELDRSLSINNRTEMLDAWRQRASLGQTQTFEHHGQRITGQVLDLDPDHGLIVRRDTGELITLPAATTSVVVS